MAYKYFTKRLLQDGSVDLASVFPDKQAMAREQCNVSYGLPEIVDYLRTATDGFKFSDQRYIDLDNAVRAIIGRYYTSKNMRNPFEETGESIIEDEYVEGNEPKKAAIVADGKTRQKELPEQKFKTPLPPQSKEAEQIAVAAAVPPAPVDDKVDEPVLPPVESVPDMIAIPAAQEAEKEKPAPEPSKVEILDAIEVLRFLADDGDEGAKEAIESLELLLED